MKRAILLIAAIMVSQAALAQQHMKFEGVPLEGNTENFAKKMSAAGYKFVEKGEGYILMTSETDGKGLDLFIYGTPKSNTVCRVALFSSRYNTWTELKAVYEKAKEILTFSLGKPTESQEKFTAPYNKPGDEMKGVDNGGCDYSAIWSSDNGVIFTNIANSFRVVATVYEDKAGAELYAREE